MVKYNVTAAKSHDSTEQSPCPANVGPHGVGGSLTSRSTLRVPWGASGSGMAASLLTPYLPSLVRT